MPARLLVKEPHAVTDQPPDQLSEMRGEHPCWLDISDPRSEEFELAATELNLHPLAVEDAQNRHQRPKIDEYDDHYFIVVYALEEPSPDVINQVELSIFFKHNAIVTVHEGSLAALQKVEKRFRDGKIGSAGLLLHAILDTIVDTYFDILDGLGDRVELDRARRTRPIRDLREPGRRAYFQDLYDHIIRVTDEVDTFRDLVSNVVDAHLAAVSNRLNEVMKVLTSVATVLLILNVVTGFFGQNWDFIPYGSQGLFWLSMVVMIVGTVGAAWYFKRKGWL